MTSNAVIVQMQLAAIFISNILTKTAKTNQVHYKHGHLLTLVTNQLSPNSMIDIVKRVTWNSTVLI